MIFKIYYKIFKKNKTNSISAGFTLIEMITVIGVFAVVLVAVSEMFLSIFNVYRVTNASRILYQDARYALETISREVKLAKNLDISPSPTNRIKTTLEDGTNVTFRCENCTTASTSGVIKFQKGTDPEQNLTSSSVVIKKFEISSSEVSKECLTGIIQPFFKLVIEAETKSTDNKGNKQKVALQTLISKRNYLEIGDSSELRSIASFSIGQHHSLVLTTLGQIWGAGLNFSGQLGVGNFDDKTGWTLSSINNVKQISAGGNHSLAVTNDGKIYAVGDNLTAQLGIGSFAGNYNTWQLSSSGLPGGTVITAVSGGSNHSLALTSDGKIYAVGHNGSGRLGIGNTTDQSSWQLSSSGLPGGTVITAISAGFQHSLALASDGKLYSVGDNGSGRLGIGNTTNQSSWQLSSSGLPGGTVITAISAGFEHSLVTTSAGQMYGTGENGFGQLGTGNTTDQSSWQLSSSGLPGGKVMTSVSTGETHSLSLASDGKVYTTGRNGIGELGLGYTNLRELSWKESFSAVKAILTDDRSRASFALTTGGRLYATGSNGYGKMGICKTDSELPNTSNWTLSF